MNIEDTVLELLAAQRAGNTERMEEIRRGMSSSDKDDAVSHRGAEIVDRELHSRRSHMLGVHTCARWARADRVATSTGIAAGVACGSSGLPLDDRLIAHTTGHGARLLAVVTAAGIGFRLARTWPGTRARERQLKRQGGASRRCPLCGITPRPTTRREPA